MNSPIKYILDGELYNDSLDFTEISSKVNSETYNFEEDEAIQFHMYDFIDMENLDKDFLSRLDMFWNGVEEPFDYIKHVDQVEVNSEEELMELLSKHLEQGYEGTMLKHNGTPYVFGKRSNSLLKVKIMETDEFLIIDVLESDQDRLKPKVILRASNGETFSTGTVKGNKEEVYQKYLVNKDQVIGKWMTVQYQTLSVYGIPLFPQGIGIREGKVVDGKFVPEV